MSTNKTARTIFDTIGEFDGLEPVQSKRAYASAIAQAIIRKDKQGVITFDDVATALKSYLTRAATAKLHDTNAANYAICGNEEASLLLLLSGAITEGELNFSRASMTSTRLQQAGIELPAILANLYRAGKGHANRNFASVCKDLERFTDSAQAGLKLGAMFRTIVLTAPLKEHLLKAGFCGVARHSVGARVVLPVATGRTSSPDSTTDNK
jgi:hypothetical protein